MGVFLLVLLISIALLVLDILITGLIRWDYERNNPSYIKYEDEGTATVYVYERQGRICKYYGYKFIKDEEKWCYKDSLGKRGRLILIGVIILITSGIGVYCMRDDEAFEVFLIILAVMTPLLLFVIEHNSVCILTARSILLKDLQANG